MFLPLLHPTLITASEEQQQPALSAAQRVLGIGELLENILIFVDQADLLRCRRVSSKFLQTVTSSKPLRRALFLEVDDDSNTSSNNIRNQNVNPLAPTWFRQKKIGYRSSTIAAGIDLVDLWAQSQLACDDDHVKPLWHRMHISQCKTKTCVIPVGAWATIFFRRSFPDGMTFLDLQTSLISAFEIRKGRKSSLERLRELSEDNSVLIYWS